MKSAYERALERSGVTPVKKLTDAQKQAIAELDRKFQAKTAEAELNAQERRKAAGNDAAKLDQIRADLTVELASIREKAEREKDRVRNAAG